MSCLRISGKCCRPPDPCDENQLGTPSAMIYKNEENGYQIEIPDTWEKREGYFGTLSHHSVLFGAVGEKTRFESDDSKSKVTLTAGKNLWPTVSFRKAAVKDFLIFNVFLEITDTDIAEVEGFFLGGARDTVYYRYDSPHGRGRFISAVRSGREYTIRTSIERDAVEQKRIDQIDAIIQSFAFID
jgi:hypothetical protein